MTEEGAIIASLATIQNATRPREEAQKTSYGSHVDWSYLENLSPSRYLVRHFERLRKQERKEKMKVAIPLLNYSSYIVSCLARHKYEKAIKRAFKYRDSFMKDNGDGWYSKKVPNSEDIRGICKGFIESNIYFPKLYHPCYAFRIKKNKDDFEEKYGSKKKLEKGIEIAEFLDKNRDNLLKKVKKRDPILKRLRDKYCWPLRFKRNYDSERDSYDWALKSVNKNVLYLCNYVKNRFTYNNRPDYINLSVDDCQKLKERIENLENRVHLAPC